MTEFDAEPIPEPQLLFASLKDKRFVSNADLAKGYWQVPLAPEDREKTAFRAPQGLLQFVRMPFGMTRAPSSLARMVRKLELERFIAVTFLDDILVATETWEQHLLALDG